MVLMNKMARSDFAALTSKRKTSTFGLVAVLGLTGAILLGSTGIASAQENKSGQFSATPYANAPLSFADLALQVRTAVVSINVSGRGEKPVRRRRGPDLNGLPNIPKDHPLYEFFKQFREGFKNKQRGGPRARPRRSLRAQGSGFIISPDGYVVTNHHVIADASEIKITLDDGEKFDAKLIGSDKRTDLALLKITAKRTFDFVSFASQPARVGDWVLAVGNPFGLGGTVTAGIVSAHGRSIGSGPYDYLQIDAAVNKGNSGGPAFNLRGEVIGVNSAIYSPSGGNVGIAFAVPAQTAKSVIKQHQSADSHTGPNRSYRPMGGRSVRARMTICRLMLR